MRDDIILGAVVVVATASVFTSFGIAWLCAQTTRVSEALLISDALARIEAAAEVARTTDRQTAGRIDVTTELAYQNQEAARTAAQAAADVAHDLADSIARADALPNDGNYGAAADAALRSPEEGEDAP